MIDKNDDAAAAPPFYTRYGFTRTGEPDAPLLVEAYPEICVGNTIRATVVASAIDLVGGFFTRALAGTDATFTSDLSLRIPNPGRPETLLARGEPLRSGRRLVSTGVSLFDGDEVYAYGQTTFARIPREGADPPDLDALSTPLVIERHPLSRPLDQEVGVEVLDASRGLVHLAFRRALLNPEGVLQGALVALLAECSALALANDTFDAEHVVCEMDLRYLASAAIGPVEGRAQWIRSPAARMLAVRLCDLGRDARLTTTALVRVVEIC